MTSNKKLPDETIATMIPDGNMIAIKIFYTKNTDDPVNFIYREYEDCFELTGGKDNMSEAIERLKYRLL